MNGVHDLGLFCATVFVLNATPGVDLMLTLTRTLQFGIRGGLCTAFGVSTGCVVHALAAAFGLAALLATSADAFALLKWSGAAYLLWLAFGMLGSSVRGVVSAPTPRSDLGAAHDQAAPVIATRSTDALAAPPSALKLFRQGLLTNLLNPKVALFFLALLPQFIDGAAADKTLAFLFLGAWFVAQGTLFLVGFVLLVAPLRRWQPYALVERVLRALGGGLFVVLAARLALSPRP